MARRLHPAFQAKTVVRLECKYCERCICARGMRALLLADTSVELYSTDLPPQELVSRVSRRVEYLLHSEYLSNCIFLYSFWSAIQLVGPDYTTDNCDCKIKDVACLGWWVIDILAVAVSLRLEVCSVSNRPNFSYFMQWKHRWLPRYSALSTMCAVVQQRSLLDVSRRGDLSARQTR